MHNLSGYRPGTLVLVEQAHLHHLLGKKKTMMEKLLMEIVPAAGAHSKLNGIVPRAIFYDLV